MVGRLAPSPTGILHWGNASTALLAWLQVRSKGGTLLLRIEDLDPQRSKPEFAEGWRHDLAWLVARSLPRIIWLTPWSKSSTTTASW